jgi:hypothetical protein
LIHDLAGDRIYTKLDIRWGYNNIRIKDGNKWKATFKTSEGLFEPMVIFFRLMNSPATFQMMMDDIFQQELTARWKKQMTDQMISTGLKVYMDNILIFTKIKKLLAPSVAKKAAHQEAVTSVLQWLCNYDLYLKPEKYIFEQPEVKYLGVIVGNSQIKMDPVKVEGIVNWPKPTTVREVWSFLGFCNFYCPFIRDFSWLAGPLNALTKKNKTFLWEKDQQNTFQALKKNTCTSYPVLHMPEWSRQFILETDASNFALEAVISQEFDDGIHSIAFHSCSLLDTKRNYNAHDKELAGIIFGLQKGQP